jgi:hypothetical protein
MAKEWSPPRVTGRCTISASDATLSQTCAANRGLLNFVMDAFDVLIAASPVALA